MSNLKVSVILHYSKDAAYENQKFLKILQSILEQTNQDYEIFILNDCHNETIARQINEINTESAPIHLIEAKQSALGGQLNETFKEAKAPYILYMDNRTNEVYLKKGAIDLFLLTVERNKQAGLVYADYELVENLQVKEIHLLKHHQGKVRDNQDYGKVYFIKSKALKEIKFADEKLKFNTIYDLRLKLSEKNKLVHAANRYAGSLYRIVAESKSHNVFDYLLASKESQLEAEQVLTGHLKRIKACLAPFKHYTPRPEAKAKTDLKASVIIPVNNRPEFIGTAIESVQAQTIKEVEVIVVVNGGKEDQTAAEVKRYMPGGDKYDDNKPAVQLLVFDINNLGLCLNMGAKTARGEFYVQLDSDDRLKPDAVEKIIAVFDADPNIGMVIGSYEVWEKEKTGNLKRMEDIPVVTHDEWTEENGRNNLLRINGAGAPRSIPIALINMLGFSVNDEPYARNYGEDYDMVLRISERHRIGRIWEPIYEVVRHSGGTDHSIDQATIDRNDEAKDYMRLKAIERRIKINSA
ncbi:MAG: glycosyltransferase family 2 protein [Calditrichales bacterium]|nr:glycosyltransferase family 2 protein [Calditrichales bacterium]